VIEVDDVIEVDTKDILKDMSRSNKSQNQGDNVRASLLQAADLKELRNRTSSTIIDREDASCEPDVAAPTSDAAAPVATSDATASSGLATLGGSTSPQDVTGINLECRLERPTETASDDGREAS
jgi:hypothetical protein